MKGIKMSDCKFYVDEAARTVVCVIPFAVGNNYTQDMLLDFVKEHFRFPEIYIDVMFNYKYEEELKMPRSFMGKAVCSQDDVWDEEVGRMLAFSRAKDKCYRSFFKRANNLVQTIDRRLGDMITAFNDFGMKLEDKRISLEHKIEEKTKVGDA